MIGLLYQLHNYSVKHMKEKSFFAINMCKLELIRLEEKLCFSVVSSVPERAIFPTFPLSSAGTINNQEGPSDSSLIIVTSFKWKMSVFLVHLYCKQPNIKSDNLQPNSLCRPWVIFALDACRGGMCSSEWHYRQPQCSTGKWLLKSMWSNLLY